MVRLTVQCDCVRLARLLLGIASTFAVILNHLLITVEEDLVAVLVLVLVLVLLL
jgi:hypothetical protein